MFRCARGWIGWKAVKRCLILFDLFRFFCCWFGGHTAEKPHHQSTNLRYRAKLSWNHVLTKKIQNEKHQNLLEKFAPDYGSKHCLTIRMLPNKKPKPKHKTFFLSKNNARMSRINRNYGISQQCECATSSETCVNGLFLVTFHQVVTH